MKRITRAGAWRGAAAAGLVVALAGCRNIEKEMNDSYEALKASPTEANTKKLLSFGQRALRFLEGLPKEQRRVVLECDEVLDGLLIVGGASKKSYLRGKMGTMLVVEKPMSSIKRIEFLEAKE